MLIAIIESKGSIQADFTERLGFIANRDDTSQKLVIKRKVIWKHKAIRTNRAHPALPDSKAANREIATKKNVNANSASAKNKVANRVVAANRGAVSNGDDKPVCPRIIGRREATPAACYVREPVGRLGLCADTLL
jgi:hypothetical protein